jgi:Leucine-rich repeat (LRR) protein
MNSLTALDLSQNQISKFPRNFPVSLLALDLSFNSIVVVSSTALKKLSNLIELSLANNKITR